MFDNRARPAVEGFPALTGLVLGAALLLRPTWFCPLLPQLATGTGLLLALLGLWRFRQALCILTYRHRLRHTPRCLWLPARLPIHRDRLFLGLGFPWEAAHSQRLAETRATWAGTLHPRRTRGNTCAQKANGDPTLHGVGLEEEREVWLPESERDGHCLVLGTTGVGKTRLAELLISQDLRRRRCVIVLDPKGDAELLRRLYQEARRAGRLHQFHIFHLGFPRISERYNPVGEFERVTEVASRLAAQLPKTGDSAAFREFAWRFTHIVARALQALRRTPTVAEISRHLTHLEPLLVEYCEHLLEKRGTADWRTELRALRKGPDARRPGRHEQGRGPYAMALIHYLRRTRLTDEVVRGLESAFAYDKTYFDKLTASLLPLLEKLSSGEVGELLSPGASDALNRPLLQWGRLVSEQGIAYVGLDALADPEVAAAVGSCMFSDLASVAARVYRERSSRPGGAAPPVCLHADEFSELIGPEFIPLLNKGRGAGFRITAYTQSLSDIEVGAGNRERAGQVIANFNTLLALRVRDEETARLFTRQLPLVNIYGRVPESRCTDDNDLSTSVDFVSQTADRITETQLETLSANDLISLPRGHAFALTQGGMLYKLRIPLLEAAPDLPIMRMGETLRALHIQR